MLVVEKALEESDSANQMQKSGLVRDESLLTERDWVNKAQSSYALSSKSPSHSAVACGRF